MRLQKFLSRAGVASRRRAEGLVRAGRVRVNGQVVTEMGSRVDPARDKVEVDGRPAELSPPTWLALHKPPGYVSTRRDPGGRRTVYELVPDRFRELFYVGRLDADSEGLMLLTNEGDVAHRLLHPRYGVERVYEVDVDRPVSTATLRRLEAGVPLEDGEARARRAERLESPGGGARLRLTLAEGRKREVRRMMAEAGHRVQRLRRVRYGPVRLGALRPGAWRPLSARELRAVRSLLPSRDEPEDAERGGGTSRT